MNNPLIDENEVKRMKEEMPPPEVEEQLLAKQKRQSEENDKTTLIQPLSIANLIESNPNMRPVVVDGVLRRGETANIIAAAKVGKSHLAGGLAWCIVTGTPWLSHDVTKGRVLVIDNELHL